MALTFLSTPPSRVATTHFSERFCGKLHVSIHATLAGGDGRRICATLEITTVSIHATLAGGDSRFIGIVPFKTDVSIHATLAGGDRNKFAAVPHFLVSIHATLAGGDFF